MERGYLHHCHGFWHRYTPTVAQACSHWSALLRRSPGLYISLDDQVSGLRGLSRVPLRQLLQRCTLLHYLGSAALA